MNRKLAIDGVSIDKDSDCYVIAEIGHNHQGSVQIAMEMMKVAKECGVNAVKLQKRDNRALYTRDLYNSAYVSENAYGATYGEHREALEFGKSEYEELIAWAGELGIALFATAFDLNSADFLANLDMPAFKIASGDLISIPLLKHVAQFKKPIILSTGGGTLDDVKRAYDAVMPINTQLCLLQCTAAYPVEDYHNLNLNVITTYMDTFKDVLVGFSDHESGIAMALVAYVLGARVIEKHFTLNRAWKGTDQAFSLSPTGLRRLVRNLRRAMLALGNGVKRPQPCEEKPLFKMSKKLVAMRELPAGHILKRDDIAMKSPGDGLPPYELDNILGKSLTKVIQEDENISFDILNV